MTLNTGSVLDAEGASGGSTASTLSTQIIIKVDNEPVGALQRLTVAQNRPLQRIQEIGTDGVIEIVPNSATTYELTAERVVFDLLRLPEAFSRGFRFIAAQRIPFDIEIFDISNTAASLGEESEGVVAMTYKNCWFTRYETPYQADNYVITETSGIWAETASMVATPTASDNLRGLIPVSDAAGIENDVNIGGRLGSLNATGLANSFFTTEA